MPKPRKNSLKLGPICVGLIWLRYMFELILAPSIPFNSKFIYVSCMSFRTLTQKLTISNSASLTQLMAVPVVEFSTEGYKIRKVFGLKINFGQMKSLNFEIWSNRKAE